MAGRRPRREPPSVDELVERRRGVALQRSRARRRCALLRCPRDGRRRDDAPRPRHQPARADALTQALLPHLRAQARAQVICLGSALGRIGLPGFSIYSASKFGLRGFAEALRRELRGSGIRVQYVGPRSTRTTFNDAAVQAYNAATGTAMDSPGRVAERCCAACKTRRRSASSAFPSGSPFASTAPCRHCSMAASTKHRRSVRRRRPPRCRRRERPDRPASRLADRIFWSTAMIPMSPSFLTARPLPAQRCSRPLPSLCR